MKPNTEFSLFFNFSATYMSMMLNRTLFQK